MGTVAGGGDSGKLAIRGGAPVRAEPLPPWPRAASAEAVERAIAWLKDPSAGGEHAAAHGPHKAAFEEAFAEVAGRKFAVAVNSGTSGLDLAIDALELPAGGVVVAAAYGHPATVYRAGLGHELRLVDVRPETLCLCPNAVARAIEEGSVRCVVTTDFAGQADAADELELLCERAGIPLVEDASHAHGARLAGRLAGSFGAVSVFSLHGSKNVPAGEGGVVTTDDEELFHRLWRGHDLGRDPGRPPYDYATAGGGHRLSELGAIVARDGLERLPRDLASREAAVGRLRAALPEDSPLALLERGERVEAHAFHLIAARYRPEFCAGVGRRRFILALCAEGIPCNAGWPAVLSDVPGVRERAETFPAPIAASAVEDSLWFDQRLALEEHGVEQIVEAIDKVVRGATALGGRR